MKASCSDEALTANVVTSKVPQGGTWEAAPCEPLPLPEVGSSMDSREVRKKKSCVGGVNWSSAAANWAVLSQRMLSADCFALRSSVCRARHISLMVRTRLGQFTLAASLSPLGCAPSSPPPPQAAVPSERSIAPSEKRARVVTPPPRVGAFDGPHQSLALRSQGLIVRLPDGRAWKSRKRAGSFSRLQHAPTESELWLSHQTARRTVSLRECEKSSRTRLSILRHELEVAHERRYLAPEGYSGIVRVFLDPAGGGRVEAYSVGVSRCFSAVFLTGAAPGFPERLQVGVNEILESIRVPRIGDRKGLGVFSGPRSR